MFRHACTTATTGPARGTGATEQARAMLILLTQNPGVALSVIQTQPHLLAVPEVKTVYDAYIANMSKPPQAQAPEQAP